MEEKYCTFETERGKREGVKPWGNREREGEKEEGRRGRRVRKWNEIEKGMIEGERRGMGRKVRKRIDEN